MQIEKILVHDTKIALVVDIEKGTYMASPYNPKAFSGHYLVPMEVPRSTQLDALLSPLTHNYGFVSVNTLNDTRVNPNAIRDFKLMVLRKHADGKHADILHYFATKHMYIVAEKIPLSALPTLENTIAIEVRRKKDLAGIITRLSFYNLNAGELSSYEVLKGQPKDYQDANETLQEYGSDYHLSHSEPLTVFHSAFVLAHYLGDTDALRSGSYEQAHASVIDTDNIIYNGNSERYYAI